MVVVVVVVVVLVVVMVVVVVLVMVMVVVLVVVVVVVVVLVLPSSLVVQWEHPQSPREQMLAVAGRVLGCRSLVPPSLVGLVPSFPRPSLGWCVVPSSSTRDAPCEQGLAAVWRVLARFRCPVVVVVSN